MLGVRCAAALSRVTNLGLRGHIYRATLQRYTDVQMAINLGVDSTAISTLVNLPHPLHLPLSLLTPSTFLPVRVAHVVNTDRLSA